MRIFSSAEQRFLVTRRMRLTTFQTTGWVWSWIFWLIMLRLCPALRVLFDAVRVDGEVSLSKQEQLEMKLIEINAVSVELPQFWPHEPNETTSIPEHVHADNRSRTACRDRTHRPRLPLKRRQPTLVSNWRSCLAP
jgi:hypothetical protein